jgi:hypothetical protein
MRFFYNMSLTLLTTLYYRINQPENPSQSNAAVIDFIPFIDQQSTYSGLENRFMMDANGVPNKDVICFIGYRTPQTTLGAYSIYSLYNETTIIQTTTGYISAAAIYNDGGTGFATEKPFVEYAVSAATGEFVGAKIITIFFDNVNKTRRVEITG